MVGYGMQISAAAVLFAVFALWSLAAWLLVIRVRVAAFFGPAVLIGLAIVAPVLLAQVLIVLFFLVPGVAPQVPGLIAIGLPLLVFMLCGRRVIAVGRTAATAQGGLPAGTVGWAVAGAVALAVPTVFLVFSLVFLPLHGNDSLEYMQLGRMLAEQRDAHLYPIRSALPDSGFIAPWTHPPTYGVLIAFAFLLQGGVDAAGAAKLIGLWFALATALLAAALVYAAERRASWRMWLTPALLLSVPVYFELVLSAHIDAMRIATFTVAIAMTSHALVARTPSAGFLAGLAVATAMLSHSIGIMAPAIVLPLLVVCWTGPVRRFLVVFGVLVAATAVLGVPYYLRNIAIFGSPIQDHVPIWDIAALRIQEFLRVTRGLETLVDQLYLGALMPWTRFELFGYLPVLLVAAAPFVLVHLLRRDGLSFRPVVATRGDSVALHLTTAALGFYALILLSVFAGSDLAVKNARYLLTILPVLIAVTIIAAGLLIDDDRFRRIIGGAFGFLGRLLPWRTRSRRVQGAPGPDAPASRLRFLPELIVLGLAMAVGYTQFMANARTAYANTIIYLDDWSSIMARLTESERMKRAASALDSAMVEQVVLGTVPPDQTVLVFQQASYGFYGSRLFRFHLDAELAPLFLLPDAASLRAALAARGLNWILLPDFPLAEINHSAFARLLHDPAFVRPVVRLRGWALLQLRTETGPPVIATLGEAQPAVGGGRTAFATTEQGPGIIDGSQASLTIDEAEGSAELIRRRGRVRELGRWDAIVSRPIRGGRNPPEFSSPDELSASDFRLSSNDPVLIEARLSGKGLAEIAVEYVTLSPTAREQSAPPSYTDMDDTDVVVSREVIWSGLLDETPRVVSGWLVSPLSRQPDGADNMQRGTRLFFRLRDGERLKLHGWSAKAVGFPESRDSLATIDTILAAGWSFTRSTGHRVGGIALRTPPVTRAPRVDWPFPPVGIHRQSTRAVTVLPPSFWLPGIDRSEPRPAGLNDLLQSYVTGGELQIAVEADVTGFGRVKPLLRLHCRSRRAETSIGLVRTVLGGGSMVDPEVEDIDLAPVQLWPDRPQRLAAREPLPCLPYRARLLLTNEVQPLLTNEEFQKNPELARTGYIDVYGVAISLVGGAAGPNPVTVPMQLRLPRNPASRP